ncbi:hypothetical protein L0Z72_03205 [candidate division KSB1 bacterium]|nr:hypothetical protein [candidate division KSB1 bacterium]
MKHGWIALESKTIRRETLEKWSDSIKQIQKIPRSEIENLNISEKNMIRIAYMVLPFFKSSNDAQKFAYTKMDRNSLVENLIENITPKPNWIFAWQVNKKYQKPIKYLDNRFEIYPMVVILALIESIG